MRITRILIFVALFPLLSFGQQFSPQEMAQITALLNRPGGVSTDMLQPQAVTLGKVNQTSLAAMFALRSWVDSRIEETLVGFVAPDEIASYEADPIWLSEKASYATISYVLSLGYATQGYVGSTVYGTNNPASAYSGNITNVVGIITNVLRVQGGIIYNP